jgi:transposase InsO family protein
MADHELMAIDGEEPEPADDWMQPIRLFLENNPPPDDNAEAERIARKAKQYQLIDGILFRRGANGMMMKCISREEGIQLLDDIHSGICGSHSSWRSIVGKAFRHGFYWPTAKDDAVQVVTRCKDCQFFQKQTTKHANPLRPIDLSWPFAIWGIDIVGILPKAPGGFKYLFVAIDTFTKWIEAMPVANISQEAAVKFLKSIVFRFGVPRWVITDNGTQFRSAKFERCCADFGIQHDVSSAAHPQTNGQVERANGLIIQGMKTRMFKDLEAKGRNWEKELPSVLWALRTNTSRATRDTPFHLVYGSDAVLPPEVFLQSARVSQFNEADQREARELDATLLEEERNRALANVQKYQEALKRHYNKSVVARTIEVGDLVLKKDIRTKNKHKFSSPWEGPFIVVEIAAPGAYVLAEVEGALLPSTWNADQLRKYYA